MRRPLLIASLFVLLPAAAEAQPRLMIGGGFTAPQGEIGEVADPGWHLGVGLNLGIPTLPVALRADGRVHKMAANDSALRDNEYLTGSISLVFQLPGVGLEPYVLGGMGTYRYSGGLRSDPAEAEFSDTGYHGGFGMVTGQLGFGLFAEIRYVHIPTDAGSSSMIPLTLGFRL